ncbi:MAG TPA: cytochrome c [Steroidobacteraceae bacterium]|jgi:mono/diheme cytochrome c family protein
MRGSARPWLVSLSILLVILAGAYLYARWPTHTRAILRQPAAGHLLHDGPGGYLAIAADCAACHTAPGGKPFAGGLRLESPVGAIYSTNITPDHESGIGNYTLDDFDRAVRHGIARNGATLYPAMPYPSYSLMTDEDVADLYDYFMHHVEPAAAPAPVNGIPWPLSMRWPVGVWRKLFAPSPDAPQFNASRFSDPQVARGAYLVEGPGHCGSCHTPRAFTLQEKALNDSSPDFLAGGPVIDGWVAVNLRGNPADGLGRWTQSDIVATLRTARNKEQTVVGSAMSDVVVHSTSQLTDADLLAIASYLKTLGPMAKDQAQFAANPATATALAAGRESNRGAELYDDNCAVCHRTDGAGSPNVLPKIAGNPTALSANADSLIRLVLAGSSLPGTADAPSTLGMPGFGWRLSNEEVAQLLTFVRSGWGNQAAGVSAHDVARVRAELDEQAAALKSPKN